MAVPLHCYRLSSEDKPFAQDLEIGLEDMDKDAKLSMAASILCMLLVQKDIHPSSAFSQMELIVSRLTPESKIELVRALIERVQGL